MINFKLLGRKIAENINGRVLDDGDREYGSIIQIDNGRVSHEPELIVVPESHRVGVGKNLEELIREDLVSDIQNTVRICSEAGAKLTVKAGGHSAAGYSLNSDGVVLDIRNLNWNLLCRDSGQLRVGMGQTFDRVYDFMEMSRTGRIPIGGGCPSVGLGGFLLGGGYSFVSRSYGLGADNMLRCKVVKANGDLVEVGQDSTCESETELFWGLRGGGGGNFGVVVESDLQTHKPDSTTLMVGQVLFPFHRMHEVLEFYNEWVPNLPDKMAVYGYLGSQPDPRLAGDQALALRFTPVYNGPFSEGVDHLKDLLKLQPISVQLFNMTLPEWEELIGTGTVVQGRSAYIRSTVLPSGAMMPEVAEIFMEHMIRRPSSSTFVVWTHAGGKVAEIAKDATAYPHRTALFVPEVKSIWNSSDHSAGRKNIEWAHHFFEDLSAYGSGGAYINYIDPLVKDWQTAYYGQNYERLLKLKSEVDPDNFFRFQQSIGSTYSPNLDRVPLDLSPLQIT